MALGYPGWRADGVLAIHYDLATGMMVLVAIHMSDAYTLLMTFAAALEGYNRALHRGITLNYYVYDRTDASLYAYTDMRSMIYLPVLLFECYI